MRGTTRNNTVSDEDGEVPESTTTFAKQRTKAEIEQDRARRLGREMRAAGVHEADSALQALYIFIDEPGSSIAARIFSVVIVLTILTSSILFVAETHSFVSTPRPHMTCQRTLAYAVNACVGLMCSSRAIRAAALCSATRW